MGIHAGMKIALQESTIPTLFCNNRYLNNPQASSKKAFYGLKLTQFTRISQGPENNMGVNFLFKNMSTWDAYRSHSEIY